MPVSLAHLPLDWVLFVAVTIVITALCYQFGSSHASALVLSFPLAQYIQEALSHSILLGTVTSTFSGANAALILFVAIWFISYALIYRMVHTYGIGQGVLFEALLSALAAAVVVGLAWVQIPQLQTIWSVGPQFATIFGEAYRLFWIIGACVVIAFVRS